MYLPPSIARTVADLPCETDHIGMSSHTVLLYPDLVLKIGPRDWETDNELTMLRFLHGKLPCPEVIAYEEEADQRYLLTTRVPGRMLCDPNEMMPLHRTAERIAEALHLLWSVPVSACPSDMGLDRKLRLIEEDIDHSTTANAEPKTYAPGGFASPEALLHYLKDNRPEENKIVTHGDLCLPNILVTPSGALGFVDLGRSGLADPWCDIALGYRSLKHNCNGIHGSYPGWTESLLFDTLGIPRDEERLRYYLLLDELV